MPRKPVPARPKSSAAARAATVTVSLARVLSKLGIASRTVASTWIAAGRVTVNGATVTNPVQRIDMDHDSITVDGAPVTAARKRYLALNKPRGLVTTARDEHGRDTVYTCLSDADRRLVPVGRLDKASEGLLLFTNDTHWAQRILDPATHVAKLYHVQIDAQPDERTLAQLRAGVLLENGVRTRQASVSVLRRGTHNGWLEITLEEGHNRQIRRMLESVGINVLRLVRVAIGPVRLGDLPKGQTRELTRNEVMALQPKSRIT